MTSTPLSTFLSFPFKGNNWLSNWLILAFILLASSAIPVLPVIFLAGYLVILVRGIVLQNRQPWLPDWDDLGRIFNDGWKPFAAALLWMLPVFAVMFAGWLVIMLPVGFIPALQNWRGESTLALQEYLALGTSLAGLLGMGAAFLLMLAIAFFLPAALTHQVVKDDFQAAFRIKEWGKIVSANFGGFAKAFGISLLLVLVFSLGAALLTVTLLLSCLVPVLAVIFNGYYALVSAALFAQAYRAGAEKVRLAPAAKIEPIAAGGAPALTQEAPEPPAVEPEPVEPALVEPEPVPAGDLEQAVESIKEEAAGQDAPASAGQATSKAGDAPATLLVTRAELNQAELDEPQAPGAAEQTLVIPPSAPVEPVEPAEPPAGPQKPG